MKCHPDGMDKPGVPHLRILMDVGKCEGPDEIQVRIASHGRSLSGEQIETMILRMRDEYMPVLHRTLTGLAKDALHSQPTRRR